MLESRCRLTGKLRFETKEDAKRQAKRFRKRFGPRMNYYQCKQKDGCNDWHIGHRRTYKSRLYRRKKNASVIISS